MEITVIKRNGSREPYQPEKIARVVHAAGLSGPDSLVFADSITKWVQTKKVTEISSVQLRDRILIELTQMNPNVAGLFSWYQKTKETA